jgi:putative endopeptidase
VILLYKMEEIIVDKSVNPVEDFNKYVNGNWELKQILPDDQTEWGTMNIIYEETIDKVINIMETLSNDPLHEKYCIGKLYRQLTKNNDIFDKEMKTKISRYLNFVNMITSISDIGIVVGFFINYGIHTFFDLSGNEDPKDAMMIKLTLGNLQQSLPEKEYYLDDKFNKYVRGLRLVVKEMFVFFDYNLIDAEMIANDVILIETAMAMSTKPVAERREHDKLYSNISIDDFLHEIDLMNHLSKEDIDMYCQNNCHKKECQQLWLNIFKFAKLNKINNMIVYDLSYFIKLSVIFHTMPLNSIKNYIKYIVVKNLGQLMIEKFDHIMFDFFGKQLHGQQTIKKKENRVIGLFDSLIGEIIGEEYATRYFEPRSKAMVMEMVDRIKNQLNISINRSEWLTQKTKEKALLKLKSFSTKIGYPDVWKDRSDLINSLIYLTDQSSDNRLMIILLIKKYNYKENVLDCIDKQRDPDKWYMNPHEVNACYSPQRNEIVFPMGILQKPLFDKDQLLAVNYGGIGSVIGHEIIHGFDDQGRKYDHLGNMSNWWEETDLVNFEKISNQMIEQYSAYKINDSNVNGALTLGENLADLGGIVLSHRALMGLKNEQMESNIIKRSNVTLKENSMLFFINYANIWKQIYSPDHILTRIMSDPHSPNIYRIYNLRNVDEFYDVFDDRTTHPIKENSMFLEQKKRIQMW